MAVAVAVVDHVTVAQHDMVGAGAPVYGLMEVVAHRVLVGETLEVGNVAVLHVVEAHCSGAFAGGGSGIDATGGWPSCGQYASVSVGSRPR